MSGSAGIRGYYYQILAGLLGSVEDDSWQSIKIEPTTKDDKVDIEWVFDNSIRVVQVKSSSNNFERSMLINWVHTLVKDAHTAYAMFELPISYQLYLIGTTDRNADKWIADLHANRLEFDDDNKLKEIESEISHVEVKKQSFDLENLEALAYIGMQEYLERNGKQAKIENIKLLCNVIVNELLRFTMQGKSMPKALFLHLVNKYVDGEEYEITAIRKVDPEISLVFYENGKVPENNTMLGIQLENTPLLNMYYTNAMDHLHRAKAIKLPMLEPKKEEHSQETKAEKNIPATHINKAAIKTVREVQGLTKSFKKILDSGKVNSEWIEKNSGVDSVFRYEFIPVRIPDKDIVELKGLSENILGIELTDEDFYFGSLKEREVPIPRMFGNPVNIPKGTDDEIAKYFAIRNGYESLLNYKNLLIYYNKYLHTCHPLPVILKNTGSVADEEIQVTLKFPPTVQVVTPLRIQAPPEPFIKIFITNASVFDELITPARDHTVMEYEGIGFQVPVLPKIHIPFEPECYTSKDFADHLMHLFKYRHFKEGDQDILQYQFKSLNPAHKMRFPTFLLLQSDTNIDIEYTIISKYLSQPIEGTLHWVHPENT